LPLDRQEDNLTRVNPEAAAPDSWAKCGDDESLFAFAQGGLEPDERSAVEAHVTSCADCRRVLAEALRALAAEDGSAAGDEGSQHRIGRYTLLELLGAGASGVVYRAFDPELERTVALKLLRSDAADATPERRERRLREARTMAQVSDANVVTVFDAGLSGGAVYIVMEYVPGSTLEEWLARSPRTLREIVAAFLAAGRGLAALHARSLVHRDFKPENVMVGGDGRIQVTDFGLARPVTSVEPANASGSESTSRSVTLTHGLFGTPAYMAPELFAGKPADARSDQFSFAVALLSAATGHHPFGADERIDVSELVLRMHKDRRELAQKATGLPARLRDALLRALSIEPEERFESMAALLSEVERAPFPGESKTHRAPLGALAVILIAGAGALFAFGPWRAPPGAPMTATEPPAPKKAPIIESTPTLAPPVAPAEAKPTTTANHPRKKPASRHAAAPAPSESRYDDRLKDPF
jgi:tRNA A-37 threonylcarbamoyl transferase component Bud32